MKSLSVSVKVIVVFSCGHDSPKDSKSQEICYNNYSVYSFISALDYSLFRMPMSGCLKLNADKAQTKAERLAGKKNAPDKPPAKTAKGVPGKKEKKEKKKAQPPASDEQE